MGLDSVFNPDGYCTARDENHQLCYNSTPCFDHPVEERVNKKTDNAREA